MIMKRNRITKKVKVFAFRNRNLPFPMKKEYTVYLLQSIQRVTGRFLLFLHEILDFLILYLPAFLV